MVVEVGRKGRTGLSLYLLIHRYYFQHWKLSSYKRTLKHLTVLQTGQVSHLVSLFSLRINQQTNGNRMEMPSCAQNKTPWTGFYQAWSERPSVTGNRPTDKEWNKIKQVELLLKGAGEMLTVAKDHI